MSAIGLQNFLNRNPKLFKKELLHNDKLVIDASGLSKALYFSMGTSEFTSLNYRNDIYGGDLVLYAQEVQNFFSSLNKCNIEPILIFQGSITGDLEQNEIDKNGSDVFCRNMTRYKVAENLNDSKPIATIIMPQNICHVFRSVVNEMDIKCIQENCESNSSIVQKANELDCPILTINCKFIFNQLNRGFILCEQFKYDKLIECEDGFGIESFIYNRELLLNLFPKLNLGLLPLLSVLLSKEPQISSKFYRFTKSLSSDTISYPEDLVLTNKKDKTLASLLKWLEGEWKDKLLEILRNVHFSNREDCRLIMIDKLKRSVKDDSESTEEKINKIYSSDGVDYQEKQTPGAFLLKISENFDMKCILLDIVFRGTHLNYAAIEDYQLKSHQYIKRRQFSILLALLRPSKNTNDSGPENGAFHIYDREEGEEGEEIHKKLKITALNELEGFGSLEHFDLHTTMTLDLEQKKSILQSAFRYNEEERSEMVEVVSTVFSGAFVEESTTCFMLIKYIALDTETLPEAYFVDALILTLYYYASLGGHLSDKLQSDEAGELREFLKLHSIMKNGISYESSEEAYRRIVHFISQLQSAYNAFCLLNGVLDHVSPSPRYYLFLNGPLIFRLSRMFQQDDHDLAKLCADVPLLSEARSTIEQLINCN